MVQSDEENPYGKVVTEKWVGKKSEVEHKENYGAPCAFICHDS